MTFIGYLVCRTVAKRTLYYKGTFLEMQQWTLTRESAQLFPFADHMAAKAVRDAAPTPAWLTHDSEPEEQSA